jgi:N-acetylglucosamine kinase-like BadF-type ATPase
MRYFLGVDGGGSKTHALIADQDGRALGFGVGGPGNWEGVGLEGMTAALQTAVGAALQAAGLEVHQIHSAGMGLAGYDWLSQREMILGGIAPLGLKCSLEIVNDATLGILAGTSQGWGVSIVSGTGDNCRGWSRDGREGRVVGGAPHWSGEYAGGYDILLRAVRAMVFEWDRRGPTTALSPYFLEKTGANSLYELVEGLYIGKYQLDESFIRPVFEIAAKGDPAALEIMRWAGSELGDMACGVVRQLGLEAEPVEVVLIGSLWKGHPLLTQSARKTIRKVAPRAALVRLTAPPVVGGVVLAMQQLRLETAQVRRRLIKFKTLRIPENP